MASSEAQSDRSPPRGLLVRPLGAPDRDWVGPFLAQAWGSTRIVTRGRLHDATALPGFVALLEGRRVGLLTYRIEAGQCEIVTLNSQVTSRGVASALLEATRERAHDASCRRLWLVTTNDNLLALRFYQRRGFEIVAVHRNSLKEARRLKPEVPLTGIDGIPLRDEIELELPVAP